MKRKSERKLITLLLINDAETTFVDFEITINIRFEATFADFEVTTNAKLKATFVVFEKND